MDFRHLMTGCLHNEANAQRYAYTRRLRLSRRKYSNLCRGARLPHGHEFTRKTWFDELRAQWSLKLAWDVGLKDE